ncbi:uncharacterized protein LOC135837900 [Planococcus citri]|uniref:uncharacterized protein LOC135837900 n=1 Tax=Planococcus citri TaxID=170843 RepID=UPI0031F9CB12
MQSLFIIFPFILLLDHINSVISNSTTSEPVLYMVKSKYDELLNLVNLIPAMREKLRCERNVRKKEDSAKLKTGDKERHDLYMKIYQQKVDYEHTLWEQRHLKNSLIYFRYLTILQNHIDDFERLARYFQPDMNQITRNFPTKISQAEEIRRQKWNYLLLNYNGFMDVRDLILEIDKAEIKHFDFSANLARGYKLLARKLKPNKLHEISPLRFLPDLSKNITGDFEADRCFAALMQDYAKKTGSKH